MDKQIQEGNKLIAEFMMLSKVEGDLYPIAGYLTPAEQLGYHTSWDWLMPVIEKISKIEFHREMEDDGGGNYIEVIHTHYPRTFGMPDREGKVMFRFNCGGLYRLTH